MMKKGDIGEGYISESGYPSRCIIKDGDDEIVVKNSIPGRKVSYRISKKRNGIYQARQLEILEKSIEEDVEDLCPSFGVCGGCLYQSMNYEAQCRLKEGQIKWLLDTNYDGEYEWEGIIKSPLPQRYRNKMEFSFGDEKKGGELMLGLHKRGSHYDIVDASDCRLTSEDINKICEITCRYFRDRGVAFFHKITHDGYLRHLLIREGYATKEILIDIVTASARDHLQVIDNLESSDARVRENPVEKDCVEDSDVLLDGRQLSRGESVSERQLLLGWVDELRTLELDATIVGILHTTNDSVADAVKNEGTQILYGRDYFYEMLSGTRFKITPFSFFQTNTFGAELLYAKVAEYAGEGAGHIYDLYSGTGTITQMMARVSRKATGVEIVEEAVIAARENARANGIENCTFICGDVLKVLDELVEKPDTIILDPPREGVVPKALKKVLEYGAKRMVYVSCNPLNFVRDLQTIKEHGYEMRKACCVDMFPGTPNMEVVAMLVYGGND